MEPPTEPQVVIDSELISLEKRVLDLRRARNLAASISRLPPEILTIIFCAALAFDTMTTSNYVALCHVCQSWRTVALKSPELWARLRIHSHTKAPLMELMWERSRSASVTLSIWDARKHNSSRHFDNFDIIFKNGMSKLQNLSLYMARTSMDLLLREVTGRAQNLESLSIIGQRRVPPMGKLDLFAGGTPNLRRIHLENYLLTWTAPIFQSSHLTHLIVQESLPPKTESMDELIAILRRLPQLQVFFVAIPGAMHDFVPITTHDTPQVEMPNMTRFSIDSYHLEVLSSILSTIRLPMDAPEIRLYFDRDATSNAPNQELYTACRRAFKGIFKPIKVILSVAGAYSDHEYHIMAAIPPALPIAPAKAQWVRIGSNEDRSHPFANPILTRTLWSFTHLNILKVLEKNIPQAVWAAFASAPPPWSIDFFFKSLENFPSWKEESQDVQDTDEQPSIGARETGQIPFPALRELVFVDCTPTLVQLMSGIETIGLRTFMDPARLLVEEVVDAFGARGGDKLVLVGFRDVSGFEYSDKMGIEIPLSAIAHSVSWGDRRLDLGI
ncbi:hypothetical protein FA13DRAFT_1735050 [Coprinellus micaceus]|uniref:F-box domain-containing protein n=1 Tax=Coprinellus micaceus TaxID=71717 RepID=A0A4Y7T721_COPMI|nr:hypothetical protein FA13DRAFT_1735050 [Coprinellus micaceus]